MGEFLKGKYKLINPNKYIGNPDNIVYRSSWELKMNQILDNNPHVLKWSSEEIIIPYIKPTDKQVHRYFPDYFVIYRDKFGNIKKEIIEIKPQAQTKASTSKNKKRRLYETITYAINMAKWEAAVKWCNQRGITFRVVTENELFS